MHVEVTDMLADTLPYRLLEASDVAVNHLHPGEDVSAHQSPLLDPLGEGEFSSLVSCVTLVTASQAVWKTSSVRKRLRSAWVTFGQMVASTFLCATPGSMCAM